MNELEIKEYILNIINTKAEDIERHGGITLRFNNHKEDNLFLGKSIANENILTDAIKCLREELQGEYDIKLERTCSSKLNLILYHVMIKKINSIKYKGLHNAKEVEKCNSNGLSMENLNELKNALLTIKNYCTDRDCKKCALSCDESCILTLNTPQDWNILDEPVIKIMTDE